MAPRASYGARVPGAGGGVVRALGAEGPASRAGLRAGDVVISAGGLPLRDVLDWRWAADGASVSIEVSRERIVEPVTLQLERVPGQSWGVEFRDAVFDGVKTCRNRCAFCFMAQLPSGLRRALYLRDDDYRLSFLQGNFITLTNLSDADVARIAEQHLSPLYVSLHAVDTDVREQLVCAREDRALERFDELLDAGIDLHVQVVLVPGVNDGDALERTLRWLAEREGVASVGIVPLGFTAHQERFYRSYGDPADAATVIDRIAPWQQAFRERDDVTWVYLADEFYLNARRDVPTAERYDGFPQYENGIGMVRSFLDEFDEVRDQIASAVRGLPTDLRVAVLAGELFAPLLTGALGSLDGLRPVKVHPVRNLFFGGNVSVTGLLTARDLIPAMASVGDVDVFFVPDIVANADGLLLDDVPAAELGIRSGRDVRLLSCNAGGLLVALEELAADPPSKA